MFPSHPLAAVIAIAVNHRYFQVIAEEVVEVGDTVARAITRLVSDGDGGRVGIDSEVHGHAQGGLHPGCVEKCACIAVRIGVGDFMGDVVGAALGSVSHSSLIWVGERVGEPTSESSKSLPRTSTTPWVSRRAFEQISFTLALALVNWGSCSSARVRHSSSWSWIPPGAKESSSPARYVVSLMTGKL